MNKLPVIGTTAASTTFCAAKILGPNDTFLWVDGNQKITAGNGSYDAPTPNAFSLEAQAVFDGQTSVAEFRDPPPSHCPGSTKTCRASCYVHGLEKHAKATYALYRHNSTAIRAILADPVMADAWVCIMAEWITENAAGGFRWHVSGDVFSEEYAKWIADVCRESPTVDHWLYTRSFDFVEPLAEVSTLRGGNLALNLSCDKDNYPKAYATAVVFAAQSAVPDPQPLRLCYLVEKDDPVIPPLPDGSVIFPDYDLRPRSVENPHDQAFWSSLTVAQRNMLCPVDSYGKSEKIRCGPCDRCLK